MHDSLDVNEYLVKAKSGPFLPRYLGLTAGMQTLDVPYPGMYPGMRVCTLRQGVCSPYPRPRGMVKCTLIKH